MLADQIQIAERRRHQNIGLASAPNQIPQDVLPVAQHILCRRGFMIHISRIDVRAAVQQIAGDLDTAGEVQWSLSVSATRVHETWVPGNQLAKLLQHSKPRCRMRSYNGAALNSVRGQVRLSAVEKPKSAGPPAAPCVYVRSGIKQ